MAIEDNICEAIELIVGKAVASANYDRTIKATIVSCVDQSIGKFKVKYQDSSFYAYATSSEVTYSKGKEVYILVPGNDMSAEKTILGTVNKLGVDYAVEPEGDEAYEVIGTNCIHSSSTFELCSYKPEERILYSKDEINLVNISISSLEEYIKKSSSIIYGAVFKTKIPTEQQFRGNYGIALELVFRDNTTNNDVTRKYIVDVNQMRGDPYKIPHDTRQYGIFDIDGENFKYIKRIYLFVEDFPNSTTLEKDSDIFIKDLELSGAKLLTADELSTCALTFVTPQGTFFDSKDTDKSTRRIEAQIKVKGKIIDKTSQSLDYYWFREDIGITSLSEEYCKYGGQGWKCLNRHNIIKAQDGLNAPVVDWVPGDYYYIVNKSESLAKETKYKCVAVYNSTTTVSKVITITNYTSDYVITIDSDQGTQFYYDIGHPTLTCKVNGSEKTGSEFLYIWAQVDNNNNFFTLNETIALNNDYNSTLSQYNTLKSQIATESKLAAANQSLLDSYEDTLESYETITRVETNKIYKVSINEITNFSTYKCAVYYNGLYIGTGSIALNNTLDVEDAYSLIINNGSQVFKYNEAGVTPTSDSVENPQALQPLSFTIFDNLGQPIDNDITKKCEIQWIVPTTNTMISIVDTTGVQPEQDLINNTEIYKNIAELTYTINKNYDIKKTNNNIKLMVTYKDMTLVSITDFTFAKEGEPGTNGTEFLCKIVPNTDNAPLYPMILNGTLNYTPKQSGRWFKVQLWHSGVKIFDSTSSGTSSENKQVVVTWEMLRNKYNSVVYDNTDISIKDGIFSYDGYNFASMPANIVKCLVQYDGIDYYATMPIITAITEDGYDIELKAGSGFRYATYSSDGRKPLYDTSSPFELIVTQEIDGVIENISRLTKTYAVNYDWSIRGKIYDASSKIWVADLHLGEKIETTTLERNQKLYKPLDEYDGECVNNAIECNITRDNNQIASIHIPIHLLINKYGHAAINGWDGNSVSVDKDGCGVILAPQVGAGQKENDNSFTGMLMGKVKEANRTNANVGLFGYAFGERTLFLNSQNGSAIFGKNNNGQIVIDPVSDVALLYSHNYWKNYVIDGKNSGLPTGYTSANENGAGMLIDLTTPQIKWGNGNFSVNSDGHIVAKGGGEIAGWKINDTKIYSSANVSGSNPKVTMDSSIAAIYSNNKSSMSSTQNGFYIGSDGFALGAYNSSKGHNPFQVNNEGVLFSNTGSIGGFTISDNTLTSGSGGNATGMSSRSGVQWAFWTGGEEAGSAPFHVGHNGELHSTKGTIGGWTIGSNSLSASGITISSQGSISSSHWSINSDGTAHFTNVYLTNGNYTQGVDLINFGTNFGVNSGGTMWAKNGSFSGSISGSSVSGGTVKGASISGGSINVSTSGNGYLRAGTDTTHVNVSGLNVGSAGIDMHSHGISNISNLNVVYNGGVYPGNTYQNIQIRDMNGGVHHFTFFHGILNAWSYDSP